MALSMCCCPIIQQEISHQQKLLLKQLLSLRQTLQHPEFSNAARGLEGMMIAHTILQQRGAVGILIGGLAHAVWNQRRKPEQLSVHKDVDVAVLDDNFELEKPFEEGIDWWLPKSGRVLIRSEAGNYEKDQEWHVNGNEVTLRFGLEKKTDLKSGLYIMGRDLVATMRLLEAESSIDTRVVECDEETSETFWEKVRDGMGSRLPRFLTDAFKGRILSNHYGLDPESIAITAFDLQTVVAIESLVLR